MKRKKAKYTQTPSTLTELNLAVQSGMDDLNSELRCDLMDTFHTYIEDKRLMLVAQEYIGTRNHHRIFKEGKVPSFKDVCVIAQKLGVCLECKNYPYKQSGAAPKVDYAFAKGFNQDEFRKFMEAILHLGISKHKNSPAVKEIRKQLIVRFRNPRNSVRWEDLFRFSAACGYQLECRLKTIAKIPDGCLTPSSVLSTGDVKHAWALDRSGREDYEALIRRLNYPM